MVSPIVEGMVFRVRIIHTSTKIAIKMECLVHPILSTHSDKIPSTPTSSTPSNSSSSRCKYSRSIEILQKGRSESRISLRGFPKDYRALLPPQSLTTTPSSINSSPTILGRLHVGSRVQALHTRRPETLRTTAPLYQARILEEILVAAGVSPLGGGLLSS